jgi:hypothetical protein
MRELCADNDMAAEPRWLSFERVIRNTLAYPGHPAVILFIAFSPSHPDILADC